MNHNSTVNQDIKSKLVQREVIESINTTMDVFLRSPEACEAANEDWDDLMSRASSPVDPEELCWEEDWVEAADTNIVHSLNETFPTWVDAAIHLGYQLVDPEVGWVNEEGDEIDTDAESVCDSSNNDDKYASMVDDAITLCDDEDYIDFEDCANDQGFERYTEVYEWWSITPWLGARLREHGEVVFDFLDFTVWGRCTTGQAILLDHVIGQIAEDMEILEGQKYAWSK